MRPTHVALVESTPAAFVAPNPAAFVTPNPAAFVTPNPAVAPKRPRFGRLDGDTLKALGAGGGAE